jgi:hypothetical protein
MLDRRLGRYATPSYTATAVYVFSHYYTTATPLQHHCNTTATPRSGAQKMLDRILGRYSLANLLSTHPPLKSNLVIFFLAWLPKKKKIWDAIRLPISSPRTRCF